MQTPKARAGSSEVPQRKSPSTPRTARQLKIPGSGSDSLSPNPASKTPKEKSPKVPERRSPRSPATEKKRPSRVSELESQLVQLQEDLKKAKDQLNTSETWKRRAQQDAEDTKNHLLAMSAKLEESQQQLMELSNSEDVRVQELRKISHDRDKAWESELEAVQKQHSIDSAALASAMNEIQKLKCQLEMVAESEAAKTKHAESAHAELQGLRMELTETLSLVEKLKLDLSDCRESEAQALELVSKTQKQLETANATVTMLRSDGIKAMEAYNSLSLELEQSKAQVRSLEEHVSKLQSDLANSVGKILLNPTGDVEQAGESGENEESNQLKEELNSLKFEVGQLRSALEASERRYQEEYIQSTLQIRSAYEQVEKVKLESGKREAELEAGLEKAKSNIEELRANLMDKETELQSVSEENERLHVKIEKNQPNERESELAVEMKKLQLDLAELKATFSSIPVYLDPPNWQQPNQQPGAGGENPQLPPPPPPSGGGGGGSSGAIRPGSMTERARMAKIPQPEAALKCPRCESTNTKFCYFNNYSLSQPRHFCKTCRRYWTRGGALRNVPVGGGCRRNRRSKGTSRSKSPTKAGSSSSSGLVSNSCTTDIIGHMAPPPPQLPILPSLHHLGDYNSTDIGLNFGGIQPPVAATAGGGGGMEFQLGSSTSGGASGSLLSTGGLVDQWRFQQVQQFPFLANIEPPTGLYPFEGIEPANYVGQLRSKPMDSGVTQLASVKVEENYQGLNLSKNFLGITGNDQYWPGSNAWTADLPGFSSSSTSHLL